MSRCYYRKLLCISALLLASLSCGCSSSIQNKAVPFIFDYGVFLGSEPDDAEYMKSYEAIVVDGQMFSKNDVKHLKSDGHTVLSYINVGSIEEYRPYYDDYSQYALDVYENWEDERWVDVTAPEWQDFVVNELAADLRDKGFDGLFVDNLDVYYHYPSEESFEAITCVLRSFKSLGFYVSINGGDVYVTECLERYDSARGIFDAVNQETVFTKIIWDKKDKFDKQSGTEREYFQEYLEMVHEKGVDVYLLEYSKDKKMEKKIREYCDEKGYRYYVSRTLNLEVVKS